MDVYSSNKQGSSSCCWLHEEADWELPLNDWPVAGPVARAQDHLVQGAEGLTAAGWLLLGLAAATNLFSTCVFIEYMYTVHVYIIIYMNRYLQIWPPRQMLYVISYLENFIAVLGLSEPTAPVASLQRPGTAWSWKAWHKGAFTLDWQQNISFK